jgi:2,3-bisphosphoglycerate-independent phosphoglycerate mutase
MRVTDRVRRAAVLLIPVLLVLAGLAARRIGARALRAFIHYETPFAVSPLEARTGPPLARQVVLVLVDGLGREAARDLPFLGELRARGADYDCRIGEPSLSLPGRAVMLSGAWQEINGQPTNYDPRPLRVEHAFTVARRQGLETGLAAGTGGIKLFAPALSRPVVYADDPVSAPFAAYQAGQRRQAQAAAALLEALRGQPALVMVELHAVDESGHGWGGLSDEYRRAAAEADAAIRGFASALDLDRDTLVVTADHGHVGIGGHGGPEEEVLHVPLVLAGAGVRAGIRGVARQVDVAPTLSTLLGLAIPSSNQGRPLLGALALDPGARAEALRAVVAQREQFVARYVRVLATLDDRNASIPPPESVMPPATLDEAGARARLDALDEQEAAAKEDRRAAERRGRVLPAALVALAPFALGAALLRLGLAGADELRRASLAALGALVLYHLALPVLGLRYSLSAVNKDEWLPLFFRKDMVLGLAVCALAVAAGAWRERRRQGAELFDLARFAWLVTAAFCSAFIVKTAVVYGEQGAATRWTIADMRWAFAFYLDVLVLMAVGVASPLMVLPAGLAALRPPPPPPAPEAAALARGTV